MKVTVGDYPHWVINACTILIIPHSELVNKCFGATNHVRDTMVSTQILSADKRIPLVRGKWKLVTRNETIIK